MRSLELHPAYVFDCDHCGREVFQRSISRILNPSENEDAKIIRGYLGMAEDEEIPDDSWYRTKTRPDYVVCPFCNTKFVAVDTSQE